MSQSWPGSRHYLSCFYNFPRILLSTTRQFLVRSTGFEAGDDIVHGFVDVELFAAEYVDERVSPVGEGVYADVALGDDDEAADAPLRRIVLGTIDEGVGCGDLGHGDDVRQLV